MQNKLQRSRIPVIFHDIKTGCWEKNELHFPLVNQYTPGLSSIYPVRMLPLTNKIITLEDCNIQLTAPTWYQYVFIGLRMLFVLIKHKMLWLKAKRLH